MADLVQRLDLDSVGSSAAQPVLPVLASALPEHERASAVTSEAAPKRPGTYGARGLSGYAAKASELLYGEGNSEK